MHKRNDCLYNQKLAKLLKGFTTASMRTWTC